MPKNTDTSTSTNTNTNTNIESSNINNTEHKDQTHQCSGCGLKFSSRNAIFKHLRDTEGECLSGEDYEHFCQHVRKNDKGNKVVLLFGYLPCDKNRHHRHIVTGDDAAVVMLEAIQTVTQNTGRIGSTVDKPDGRISSGSNKEESIWKYSRSYGASQRGLDFLAQDENSGAVTEVLTTRLSPVSKKITMDQWLDKVQSQIDLKFPDMSPSPVRILGRQEIKTATTFNAEMDTNHRRVEYLLPVDFISWNQPESIKSRLESLTPFSENNRHNLNHTTHSEDHRCDEETRLHLFSLRKLMQGLSTLATNLDMNDEAAIHEKTKNLQKRKGSKPRGCKKNKAYKTDGNDKKENKESHIKVTEQHRILKRKRFHNFTPTLMAHDHLAKRRLDRFYHRATLTFPSKDPSKKAFILLSITGDMFLKEQIRRVIGLFLAVATNLIDKDILDCVFDEDYPHLVPTPAAPLCGMVAREARYMTWEGKLKSILSPRVTDRYPGGWNEMSTLKRVEEWQEVVYEKLAEKWMTKGRTEEENRLQLEKDWTESVLLPWVEKAKVQLIDYRQWKEGKSKIETENIIHDLTSSTPSMSPTLASVDSTVPEAFKDVLFHLRNVDKSGQWPSTTLKRQMVMVSTSENDDLDGGKATLLSLASMRAKSSTETRSSAYSFTEGQGGASGSFTVGMMPNSSNSPKSNFLFPDLVRAAFELERVLFPNREPSSTIAINRNAQFRPHTDSGAGAGQSTSLIVGLGTYYGGELLVEGEKHDIRYNAIEFDGWKQRHWTLPFEGERYSLVWFTPKGCEGMRGIDLDLSQPPAKAASNDSEELI